MDDTDKLLTPEQTADLLQISIHTLASWRKESVSNSPGLPWIKIGGQVRYRRPDVQAWIESLSNGGTPA